MTNKSRLLLAGLLAAALAGRLAAQGLPGEYVVTQKWRDLLAYYSPLSNPAFLSEQGYTSVRGAFSGSPTADTRVGRLWEMGVVQPIGFYQSIGVTWIAENGGEIEGGRLDGVGNYVPSSGIMSNQNSFFTGTYAINPWRTLTLGLNINGVYQTNFDSPKTGIGADVGVSYRIVNHPILGYHVLGVAYQNLIPPKAGTLSDDMRYSSQLRLTHHAKLIENLVVSNLQVDITDFTAKTDDFLEGVTPTASWDLFYHLGVRLLRMVEAFGLVGVNDDGLEYWGLAGGITLPMVNAGRDAEALYQYRSDVKGNGAPQHSVYLRIDMGRHREEISVRKMSRTAGFTPDKLYIKAMELFHKGKYWDAYFIFRKILVRHPDFFKNDWVQYYSGRCQEAMDMRSAAMNTYQKAVVQYPASPMVHHANLGVMRVMYRNGDDLGVGQYFSQYERCEASDSLKGHACYLMGESYMRTGEYRKAIQAFESVAQGHAEYVFAQHSAAVAHIREVELDDAINSLMSCIEGEAGGRAGVETQNRSYVFLGLIFYEKLSLNQAVAALRRVPSSSYYCEDALLGLGWCALKSRQWTDCMEVGRQLQQASSKEIVQCEGMLLHSYALMMQKRYGEALIMLEGAIRVLDKHKKATAEELNARKQTSDGNRWNYDELARLVDQISEQDFEDKATNSIVDSLHVRQTSLHDSLRTYLKYVDEFGRRSLFERSYTTIRDDIEYAYAIVKKMAAGVPVARDVKQINEEQKSIDAEIEKLKQEMDQLDGGEQVPVREDE